MDGSQFSLSDALKRGPVVTSFLQNLPAGVPVCIPFLSAYTKAMVERRLPLSASLRTRRKTQLRLSKSTGDFSGAAGRHEYLSRVEYLRPDQCAHDILDRAGWRDRDLQRWLGTEEIEEISRRTGDVPLAKDQSRCFLPTRNTGLPSRLKLKN